MHLEDWQTRLHREYAELHERLEDLERFITSPKYWELENHDRLDLQAQAEAMRAYYIVLFRRVARL
jgi:hypothetical protein